MAASCRVANVQNVAIPNMPPHAGGGDMSFQVGVPSDGKDAKGTEVVKRN